MSTELVRRGRIFEPGPAFRLLSGDTLSAALRKALSPQLPALLFLDDLPKHFYGEGLEQLSNAFEVLLECKTAYVVATARIDQLTEEHKTWLAEERFHFVELPDLDEDQTGRLVDSAAGAFGLQVDDRARAEFVDERNGMPELILASMRRLKSEEVTHVDRDNARRVIRGSLSEVWAEARRYLQEQVEAIPPLLEALATFQAAGVTTYSPLVLGYAAHLLQQGSRWRGLWQPKTGLNRALDSLCDFDFVVTGDLIVFPDAAVRGMIAPAVARDRLATFLKRHQRLYQQPGLRNLYTDAELHRNALLELAVNAQWRQEYEAAASIYSAALRIQPHFAAYYNRGVVYAGLGDTEKAIADYDQTIQLQPDHVDAAFRRGLAYAEQGNLEQAIADYGKAIELNGEHAAAYRHRGLAYAEQEEFKQAIYDHSRAIELNPRYAAAYRSRGLAHFHRGQMEQAITDYDRAIELNPQDANAYYNRGVARFHQNRAKLAVADYGKAIELDPELVDAIYCRGRAYRKLGELSKAIADYDRALELNPEHAGAHFSRGNAHYQQDRIVQAIVDYGRAIEFAPEHTLAYLDTFRAQSTTRAVVDRIVDLLPDGPPAQQQIARALHL
ncbi:MAG: tetratricopeptide repeat protein, partial [Anaerolineae bacterium]